MKKLVFVVLAGVLAFPAFGQWNIDSGSGDGAAAFDKVWIGWYTSKTLGEGSRLYFNGLDWDGDEFFASKYTHSANHSDLRISIADDTDGDDKFVIGNVPWYSENGEWQSWFTVLNNGKVGIGTDNPYYKLDVNGTLRAKEIKVNLNSGADFVFEPGYRLKPLNEVRSYIKENRRLPEIPSAAEMTSGDTDLGALQVKLLQKIEELTLYTIQQQELIEKLSAKVEKLENNTK